MIIPLFDDNPTQLRPIVTICLIAACIVVFLLLLAQPKSMDPAIIRGFGLIPAALFETDQVAMLWPKIPVEMTLFTSLFIHNSWSHLLGNVLYLWVFADNIEEEIGHVKFVIFYILCGLAAALTYALLYTDSRSPMVGASGAISGVLGAYLILYPRTRILALVWLGWRLPIFLPAIIVLGLWAFFQFLNASFTDSAQGSVAFVAHIAGFAAGVILILALRLKTHRLLGGKRD